MKRIAAIFALVVTLAGCAGSPGSDGSSATSQPRQQTIVSSPDTPDPESATEEPTSATESPEQTAPAAEAEIWAVDPEPFRRRGSDGGYEVTFTMPSRNVWCRIGNGDFRAGCQGKAVPIPPGAEESCKGNEFYPPSSLTRGYYLQAIDVVPTCFNQGFFSVENPRVLEYGTSISAHGISCISRLSGVTCVNQAGHGFEMSMQVARAY